MTSVRVPTWIHRPFIEGSRGIKKLWIESFPTWVFTFQLCHTNTVIDSTVHRSSSISPLVLDRAVTVFMLHRIPIQTMFNKLRVTELQNVCIQSHLHLCHKVVSCFYQMCIPCFCDFPQPYHNHHNKYKHVPVCCCVYKWYT